MKPLKLIVIDDEPAMAGFIADAATQVGFDVQVFNSGQAFKDGYDAKVDIIFLDLMMPDMDGVEVIRFLSDSQCDAQLVLISGFDSGVLHSAEKLVTEQGLNFFYSLSKPFRYEGLQLILEKLTRSQKNAVVQSTLATPSFRELRRALKNNELLVYYQPKIGLNDHCTLAAEALVRWQHPSRGLLTPDLFIPVAERYGLIDELTWIVLEQAMLQCQLWGQQGLKARIAVNMSAVTLKDLNLPEKIGSAVERYGLEPAQITLEVTETSLMNELVKSLDILTRLRMKGFCLSIDDFGTGYSSLVQLHRMPFSEIKIDCSFVMQMESDPEARAIVETIIFLGHQLNMKIAAEGVETDSCRKILQALTCDVAQGYFFARPMPGDEIVSWVAQQNDLRSGK